MPGNMILTQKVKAWAVGYMGFDKMKITFISNKVKLLTLKYSFVFSGLYFCSPNNTLFHSELSPC